MRPSAKTGSRFTWGGSPYYPMEKLYFCFQVVWLVRSGCSGSDEFDARAAEAKHEDCTRAARYRGMLWRTPWRPLLQNSGRARHFRPSLRGEACGCRRNKSSNFVFSLLVCSVAAAKVATARKQMHCGAHAQPSSGWWVHVPK